MTRQIPTDSDIPMHGWQPYGDMHRERIRAHEKHAVKGSMEIKPWDHPVWPHVVTEEVGEVARLFCEQQLGNVGTREFMLHLREELVQVGAMVAAWIDAIDEHDEKMRAYAELVRR